MAKDELARAKNFAYPYPRLLMEGKLNITGEKNSGVKTSNVPFKTDQYYFIRTSNNIHRSVVERYSFPMPGKKVDEVVYGKEKRLGVINGVARLAEVRELSDEEQYKVFCAFNDLNPKNKLSKMYFAGQKEPKIWEPGLVGVLYWGLFFTNVKEFKNPVPLEIALGAVNIAKVARTKVLERALNDVGMEWAQMLPSK